MAQKFLVGGYEFDTAGEAREAKKELAAVQYFTNKTHGSAPEAVRKIYQKVVEQELFHTPVGMNFVETLKEQLKQNESVEEAPADENPVQFEEEAPAAKASAIKVQDGEASATEAQDGETSATEAQDGLASAMEAQGGETSATEAQGGEASATESQDGEASATEAQQEEAPAAKAQDDGRQSRLEKELRRTKARLVTSVIVNIILAAGIAAMLYIASTSSSINILNYETALQDKYSSWAQELKDKESRLKERESAVRQREAELNIGQDAQKN